MGLLTTFFVASVEDVEHLDPWNLAGAVSRPTLPRLLKTIQQRRKSDGACERRAGFCGEANMSGKSKTEDAVILFSKPKTDS
jgi:hypothetical protein